MKYELKISGGFAGLSRDYKGDLWLSEDELRELLQALQTANNINLDARDQQEYQIYLQAEQGGLQLRLTETQLTPKLRLLIDKMRKE